MASQLTDSARRALSILSGVRDVAGSLARIRPREFARLMWPDHDAFQDGADPKRAADVVYTAGGYLGRLRAKGWVDVDPDGALITAAGVDALNDELAPPAAAVVVELGTSVPESESVTTRTPNRRRAKPRPVLDGRRHDDPPANPKHRIEPSLADSDRCKSCLRPIRRVGGSGRAARGYYAHLPGGELPSGATE